MSNQELRAKTLALFHSMVSTWANELRKDVTNIQNGVFDQLEALQDRIGKYEDSIEEGSIESFVDEVSASSAPASGGGPLLAQVRRSMLQLDQGGALQDILTQLVKEVAQIAPRAAMFILKGGNCVGWCAEGFDQSPGFNNDSVRKISVPSTADTVFKAVISSRQSFRGESNSHRDNVQLLSRIGNVLPSSIFAMPLILKDKIAAVLYADSGDSREAIEGAEAIEILVAYACKLIDGAGARKPDQPTVAVAAPAPAPVVTPQPPMQPPPRPHIVPRLGDTAVPQPQPQPPRPQPVPSAPSPGPSRPVAVPTQPQPTVASAPSLAGVDPETRKLHEDAKRFARLLVSEIKLYREAEVQAGRKNRDLYDRLKDDIDRSRQLYLERVSPPVRTSSNYFNDELIRILADGDASALGRTL